MCYCMLHTIMSYPGLGRHETNSCAVRGSIHSDATWYGASLVLLEQDDALSLLRCDFFRTVSDVWIHSHELNSRNCGCS